MLLFPPLRTPFASLVLPVLVILFAGGCDGGPPAALDPVLPTNPGRISPEVQEVLEREIAAVRSAPGDGERHGRLGLAFEIHALWPEARASFDNASRLDPTRPEWPYHRAIATQRSRSVDAALVELEALVRAFPDFAPGHHRFGDLLLERDDEELGDAERAREAFATSVRLAPRYAQGYVGLGRVHLGKGRFEEAAAQLELALERNPNERMAHYLLGTAYRGLGRREDAEREFQLGVDAEYNFLPDGLSELSRSFLIGIAPIISNAMVSLAANRTQEAIDMLERARPKYPDDIELLNTLAVAYKRKGNFERALELLFHAKKLDEENVQTLVNLAETHLAKQEYHGALAYATRSTEIDPNLGRGHFSRGRALIFLQRDEEAYAALREARRLDARNAYVDLALAETCSRLGKKEEAKEYFADAARRLPDYLPAQVNWGTSALDLGDVDSARAALRAAEKLGADHPRVQDLKRRLTEIGR